MTDKVDKVETDYNGRMNRLEEATERKDWFKATPGKHSIKFLSDGTPFVQEWEGEKIHKLRFDVEVKGKELSLSVTEGKTVASFYGQLMLIATKAEPTDTLVNKTITLLVTSDGTKKTFTVLEAVDLQESEADVTEVSA